MKEGDKVQVWDEDSHKCLGWGTIIKVAYREEYKNGVPLIKLESGKTIWGNQCHWLGEKKAIKIGVNIFKAVKNA